MRKRIVVVLFQSHCRFNGLMSLSCRGTPGPEGEGGREGLRSAFTLSQRMLVVRQVEASI